MGTILVRQLPAPSPQPKRGAVVARRYVCVLGSAEDLVERIKATITQSGWQDIEVAEILADGFHFVGTPEVYAEYAEAMQRHGRDPLSIPIYDSREFWVAETAEQAWQEAKEHLFYSYSTYAAWGAAADAADGRPPGPAPWSTPEAMREREGHMLLLGDPADVVAKFKQRQAEVPITGTIMRVPPGMEHRKVLKCMELVARDVMPHFAD